jgi:hypothetical protein
MLCTVLAVGERRDWPSAKCTKFIPVHFLVYRTPLPVGLLRAWYAPALLYVVRVETHTAVVLVRRYSSRGYPPAV